MGPGLRVRAHGPGPWAGPKGPGPRARVKVLAIVPRLVRVRFLPLFSLTLVTTTVLHLKHKLVRLALE